MKEGSRKVTSVLKLHLHWSQELLCVFADGIHLMLADSFSFSSISNFETETHKAGVKILREYINYSVQSVVTRGRHPLWLLQKKAKKNSTRMSRLKTMKLLRSVSLHSKTEIVSLQYWDSGLSLHVYIKGNFCNFDGLHFVTLNFLQFLEFVESLLYQCMTFFSAFSSAW